MTAAKTTNIPDPKLFASHLIFIQFNKKLKHIEFDLNYVKLITCGKNRSLCFRTSICRIHCIDQSKSFTLLLKSNILDFETLNRVHVYRIEYVSYRQGPYQIRIDTADDRIVPALVRIKENTLSISNFRLLVLHYDTSTSLFHHLQD